MTSNDASRGAFEGAGAENEVIIRAPSRLHFGLMSFGRREGRQFGGVGAMLDTPGLVLRVSACDTLEISGLHAERLRKYAQHLLASGRLGQAKGCRIQLLHAPAPHVGLGSGTQMALALATALAHLYQAPSLSTAEMAGLLGRGDRSAVGVYGFLRGGLIIEAGKLPDETLSPLLAHVPLPASWRFLLVRPIEQLGLSGEAERSVFARLPPVPESTSHRLLELALHELAPAATAEDCDWFGAAVFEYGALAGECFATVQEGRPFASRQVAELVEQLRAMGVRGVGQTSWGPTVFGLCATEAEAKTHQRALRTAAPFAVVSQVVAPSRNGHTIDRN